jgi:WD40 repeat protein
VINALKTF